MSATSYEIGESAGYKKKLTIAQEISIKKIYAQALKTVKKELKNAESADSKTKPYQKTYLKNLEVQLQESYKNISKQVLSEIKVNVFDVSKFVVDENNDLMSKIGFNVKGAFSYIPKDVVSTIVNGTIYSPKMKLSERIWGCESKTMQDIRYITSQGVALNKSTYEIAKDLEQYVDPYAAKDWQWSKVYPGTSKRVDYNAQRLARTTITHAYQQSVKEYTEQNPFSDGIEWLASGTERMCEICEQRNGKIYKPEDLPLDHPNGMCTMAVHFSKSIDDIREEQQNGLSKEAQDIRDKLNQLQQNASEPQNITTGDVQKAAEKKIAEKKVKVPQFTNLQKTFLEPYGYTPENMPASYVEWFGKVSVEDYGKFLKLVKTGVDEEAFFNSKLGKVKYKYKPVSELTTPTTQQTMPESSKEAKQVEQKVKDEKKVKVAEFTNLQKEFLTPYGYTVDNMPNSYAEWVNKLSDEHEAKLDNIAYKNNMSLKALYDSKLGKLKYKYKSLSDVEPTVKTSTEPEPDYVKQMNEAKKIMDDLANKKISGVWKDDVSVSEYMSKLDAIPKKKQYYADEIAKLSTSSDDLVKLDKYNKLIKDLDVYEEDGKKYASAKAKYLDAKKALKSTGNTMQKFSEDMYSDAEKKKAKKFDRRVEADKYYRKILDKQWTSLTEHEKYSIWQYTENSHPFNRSLSGYKEHWDRSHFVGIGNVPLGYEDGYRYIGPDAFKKFAKSDGHVDYKKATQSLTNAIEKTGMEDSCIVFRKSGSDGLAGLIEGDLFSYNDAMSIIRSRNVSEAKKAFVGQTFTNHAFTSTGMAKDFSWSGNVYYNIFCPEGTKAMYSEPQSNFGGTASSRIYKVGDSYSYVGSEAEVILQRGTQFRVTDIRFVGYDGVEIDMEVVGQPDYFQTGLERTDTDGTSSFTK